MKHLQGSAEQANIIGSGVDDEDVTIQPRKRSGGFRMHHGPLRQQAFLDVSPHNLSW